MFKLGLVLLMISFQDITADVTDVTDGTELVMSFLVHRDGDKTPLKSLLSFADDPEALKNLSARYGYGQLTDAGKRRAYELGKYIRSRYSELLRPRYNGSEVYIRSTDSVRAKMTILTALAAIYPPHGKGWSDNLLWEPVPYTTVPIKYDFNTALKNCPTFSSGVVKRFFAPAPSVSKDHNCTLNLLSKVLHKNVTKMPGSVYPVYELYMSQISLGLPVHPAVELIWDDVETVAGVAIDLAFGIDKYIALQAGVLLKEFYKYSDQVIVGNSTQKLRIYSGHDFNVYSFQAVTQITKRQGVPKYASAYSLEVRRVTETGKYVVLPVYLPEPGKEVVYLQVKGCDQLCDYDQFVQITQKYSLDYASWRRECNFKEDIEIDESHYN